jgi:hypothetical protein
MPEIIIQMTGVRKERVLQNYSETEGVLLLNPTAPVIQVVGPTVVIIVANTTVVHYF